MKKSMKILLFLFVSLCFFVPKQVFAKNEEFSLVASDFDITANDWEGDGTGDEIENGSYLEPGQVIQIDVYYSPGSVGNLGFNYAINYDSKLFEPVYLDGELYVDGHTDSTSLYGGGVWPAAGTSAINKKKTNWSLVSNDTGSQIIMIASDSKQDSSNPFVKEGIVATFWIKVKDDVSSGSVLNLEFDNTASGMSVDRIDGAKETIETSNLSFLVNGAMSSDASLDTLLLTGNNGLNYITSPLFQSGTSIRTFSVIVPYNVSSITIAATPKDSTATVLAGGLGNKSLNVGDNSFNIVVQPQSPSASTEIYVVNVKRLSNDTSLKTLSLSGITLDNNLTSGIYTYNATVLYSTSKTTVTAVANNSEANVKSGTGLWELVNTGDTINSRKVTVEAEDCKDEYQAVLDNSCSSQDYTLNITRTAASTNNNLSDIKIDGTSLSEFVSNNLEYTLANVANSKTTINVEGILEDEKATLVGNGDYNLNVGDNTITLKVESESGQVKEYKIKVRRLSNNANLSALNVTSDPQGTLSPNFNSTINDYYTYTYDSTVTEINISATTEDKNATITSGLGKYSSGDTEANVVVTAEDGTINTYKIKFSRNKSSDNTLKSLSIDDYSFNESFSPNNTLYTATVPGIVDEININAVVNDTNATIVSGVGKHSLNYGSNTIQVRVKAENGSTKDYTITVIRSKKTISTLTDLTVDGTTVKDFASDKQVYILDDVDFSKETITIGYTKSDADSTVTGDGVVNLNPGDNTINIVVTAQDGTTKTTYTIKVYRKLSDNAYLKSLEVEGYDFEFNKTKNDYSIEVPYEVTSLNINAICEYSGATLVKGGPEELSVGENNYTFAVTAANGKKTNIYTLKVTRKKSTNTNLADIKVLNKGTNYLQGFTKTNPDYNIVVDNSIDEVSIVVTLDDNINQTVTGDGIKKLVTGQNEFDIIVTAASGDSKKYTIIITRSLNGNNKLSSLEVVDHELTPSFNKNTTSYTSTVDSDVEEIMIKATPEEETATVEGAGLKTLQTGTNTFNINVTAENKDVKTYVVVITKKASSDSSLKSLSIKEALLNEAFSKEKTSYTASVDNKVDEINVIATANDDKVKSITGTGNIKLKTGDNTINIVVTAEDNTTTTYTIIVNRAKSLNANLTSISLSNGYSLNETFSKDTLEYTATVPNSMSKILISATKEDELATVSGTGTVNLKTGYNDIEIVVLAEDTSIRKIYKIKIFRALSNNAYLSNLSSTDGIITPTFEKTQNNYTLTVPNEVVNASLVTTCEDSEASISIVGNDNLKVGTNRASITVTAEDGTINTYYVDITRQPSSNNFLSDLKVVDTNGKNYIDVFSKTNLIYNIEVGNEISTLDISAVAEDSDTTITGVGKVNLEVGNNEFKVISKSANGTIRTYVIKVVRNKNSNTNLKSISVDGQTLVPDFNPNEVSYQLSVSADIDEIIINATAEEEKTTSITGTGKKQLRTGVNTFNIVTKAEDDSTKTYVIVVNKAASSNNYLASLLSSEELTPSFDRETINYQVTVPNEVDTISISGVAEDANATVTGNDTYNLSVGNNSILITVTAEDNSFRVYTIAVYREPSTNNYLKDLKINNQTINDFSKTKVDYELQVTNDIVDIDVFGIVEDETANVVGNKKWYLNTGVNIITITVTSQSGDSRIYTIQVTRDKSSNNNLALLSAKEGTLSPEFSKENTKYTMDVPYEITSLNINAIAEDATATVEIEGNVDFQIGSNNTVYIAVTAEDNSVKKYEIKVTRLPQANNFLSNLNIETEDGKKYSLTPEFNKNVLNYNVDISGEDNVLIISGTKEASSATVTGFEKITINGYPYVHKVVVTSAGGVARTYSITFNKIKSSNANLKELSISGGTLTPVFNENTTTYKATVSSTVDSINVTALGYDGSSVVGDGIHSLSYGNNTIKISVTAEDGSVKNYTINIEREKDIEATLSNLTVTSAKLTPEFSENVLDYIAYISDDASNVVITPTLSNSLAKMSISLNDGSYQDISSLTVSDLEKENKIKIKVQGSNDTNIYTVTILNQSTEKITSDIYGHDISDGMIKTVKINTTSNELKDQLDNDNSKLKIYKSDGVTECGAGDDLATGMIVKLIINDVVVDQKIIVVVGDTDGNGLINAIDALKVVNNIIETERLYGPYLVAADTNKDNIINAIDALKIVNHIIGNERLD